MGEQAAAPRRFLVETHPAGIRDTEEIGARARDAARALRSEGVSVRFLRTVVVPEDNRCYLLWEAESRRALFGALRRAGYKPAVVSEALIAAPATPTTRR